MKERCEAPKTIRDPSPCKDCQERFTYCTDRCPKDERGEYGHKAWTDELKRVKDVRRKYINNRYVREKKHNGGTSYGKK